MTKTNPFSRFIGDRQFYQRVLAIAFPIVVQEGITNFVNMLDNIMVGRLSTMEMSAVAIVNLLMFVFNLSVFGALSGAGLFGAQFYGADNMGGVRYTLRFKLLVVLLITFLGIVIFKFQGDFLVNAFLRGKGDVGSAEETLLFAREYLDIMLWGLVPLSLSMVYSSTLRETGETVLPMKASFASVFVNLIGNYILIFGNFGAPRLGVRGAAIATVISRFVACAIEMIWTHAKTRKNPFAVGLYKSLYIPYRLTADILKKGWPLMINEFLWAAGITMLNQCYSVRGLSVVAATNITDTIGNMFNIIFISMGSTVSIIVGHILGSGDFKKARETDTRLIAFSVFLCTIAGCVMAAVAPFFPMLYETEDSVRSIATKLIFIRALYMPVGAFLNASYFTLRSGGSTFITFIFDSVSVWALGVPVAFVLSRFTSISIVPLYFLVEMMDLFKAALGFVLVRRGKWMRKIVE